MPFIGIISDEDEENSLRRSILESLNLSESSVLIIKEKSIEDIQSVKFETVIIQRKFEKVAELKEILKNVKYVIINSDIESILELLKDLDATVITYGFNSKATITASSVSEEEMIICIQRTIKSINGKDLEPQELKMKLNENPNHTMAIAAIKIIYN